MRTREGYEVSEVEPLRIKIGGDFLDAFPYMDYLFLLTADFELFSIYLPAWLDSLSQKMPTKASLAYLRFDLFAAYPDQFDTSSTELDYFEERFLTKLAKVNAYTLLDLNVYNKTIYIATDRGVFNIDIQATEPVPIISPLRSFLQEKVYRIRTKFGIFTAACGESGVLSRAATIESAGNMGLYKEVPGCPAYELSWHGFQTLAISQDELGLIINERNHQEKVIDGQREECTIENFGKEVRHAEALAARLTFESGFASQKSLYVWTKNEVLSLAFDDIHLKYLPRRRNTAVPCKEIHQGMSFSKGLIFDTNVGTIHVDPRTLDATMVSEGPNVTVRVFTNSVHYKEQVWSIKEDCIDIRLF